MSKYDVLTEHLRSRNQPRIPMHFSEIERVLGFRMPFSSKTHRAWWSNNPSNNVMTRAWLAAGYRTEQVDLGSERVVFARETGPKPSTARPLRTSRHPAWGIFAGRVKIMADTDLSEPADEAWGRSYER